MAVAGNIRKSFKMCVTFALLLIIVCYMYKRSYEGIGSRLNCMTRLVEITLIYWPHEEVMSLVCDGIVEKLSL